MDLKCVSEGIFSRSLQNIFYSLNSIHIESAGLKEITRDDFKGFENLEEICFGGNELTTLPNNLFEKMPNLKRIDFGNNKLEFVSSKLLEPVINNGLTLVDFRGNKNIDDFFEPGEVGSVATLKKLMEIIDEKCKTPVKEAEKDEPGQARNNHEQPTHNAKIIQSLSEFWASGSLSDFTIIAGSKQFKVHKLVLSLHSPVYAEMFIKQAENIEMKIEDITAEAVHDFLRYLYLGELPESNNAMDAFALSAKLEVAELKSICERQICEDVMNNLNAYKVFMLGKIYASEKLKFAAFNQIKSIFPDVDLSESLMQEPESLKQLIAAHELLERFKIN